MRSKFLSLIFFSSILCTSVFATEEDQSSTITEQHRPNKQIEKKISKQLSKIKQKKILKKTINLFNEKKEEVNKMIEKCDLSNCEKVGLAEFVHTIDVELNQQAEDQDSLQ